MTDDLELHMEIESRDDRERQPILELRPEPTVKLQPLPLPPIESALGSSRGVWFCIGLVWVVLLGLVALSVQLNLVQDQWVRLIQEGQTDAKTKWSLTEAKFEVEQARHVVAGTQGVEVWTIVDIVETALPPLYPPVVLQGRYELTAYHYFIALNLTEFNATWWYGDPPNTNVTEAWYVLRARQGQAQVYQSLDGARVCASPPRHDRPSTCVVLNASLCASLVTLSYTDSYNLVQATWTIHQSTHWCPAPEPKPS